MCRDVCDGKSLFCVICAALYNIRFFPFRVFFCTLRPCLSFFLCLLSASTRNSTQYHWLNEDEQKYSRWCIHTHMVETVWHSTHTHTYSSSCTIYTLPFVPFFRSCLWWRLWWRWSWWWWQCCCCSLYPSRWLSVTFTFPVCMKFRCAQLPKAIAYLVYRVFFFFPLFHSVCSAHAVSLRKYFI